MKQKEFEFKAFVYTYNWQPALIFIIWILFLIIIPGQIITKIIWQEDSDSMLFLDLKRLALVSIPLTFIALYLFEKVFLSKIIISFDKAEATISLKKKFKTIFETNLSDVKQIKFVNKKQNKTNKAIILRIRSFNKGNIIIRSIMMGNDNNPEYVEFLKLYNHITEELKDSDFSKKEKIIGNERLKTEIYT
ncbi:hypothetical protein [uncultured Aquimarina sp.]|uniref:hypothetical protein n=1 Tax=uncultured Aquimarina sp. TaxID=575652 RepID=UPI00261BF338|nr:hypothetical protein [uncultured Aquimarina sp.]